MRTIIRHILLLTFLIICHIAESFASPKPVAMVTGRERYDGPRFTKRVMALSDYVWEDCGTFLDPEEFKRYSIVVWFSGCKDCEQPFDESQIAALREYLEGGGVLFHTGNGIYTKGLSANLKLFPWTGGRQWRGHNKSRFTFPILRPEHPYLAGIDPGIQYSWQTAYFTLDIDTEKTLSLVGEGARSIFCVTQVGKGRIVWLWEGLFRARNWEQPESDASLERIFLNVVKEAKPLTSRELIAENSSVLADDPASLVLWRRDWDYASQSDYVILPPYAKSEDELGEISFNSAMDERDTQFVFCQSLVDQRVAVEVSPLINTDTQREAGGELSLYISGKPPEVPSRIRPGDEELPAKLGRFMLLPLGDSFVIDDWRPRVLWLQLSTTGLIPGDYRSSLKLRGKTVALEVPIKVKVYPVKMPRKRLVELRYWGQNLPNHEPFLSEAARQNCSQMTLSRADLNRVRIRSTGQPLNLALRSTPDIFKPDDFPALDFRDAYDEQVDIGLDYGLSHVLLYGVNTGETIARRGGKEPLARDIGDWTVDQKALYVAYYRELYGYLTDKGFGEISMIWGDEPSWGYIQTNYIPRVRLLVESGMGAGTTWTVGGFQRAEQVAAFAPYTTDWSMYTIMMPNFLSFLREGSVSLHPRARVGITRGGSGFALRNPFNLSRTYAWSMAYYGQPLSYLRTGPIWKEWRYYGDSNRGFGNRPDGVEGARLIAYGSSDPQDGHVPLLSSSDWESSREGVDDVNLVRMLEWYLDKLGGGGPLNRKRRNLVRAIRADMATWFQGGGEPASATAGFDEERLTDEDDGTGGPQASHNVLGFSVLQKEWVSRDIKYSYQQLAPPSTTVLEALKKRVLDHLESLLPYADDAGASLLWHDWILADSDKVSSTIVIPDNSSEALREAVGSFLSHCRELSGVAPRLALSSDWNKARGGVSIVVGIASEEPVRSLLQEKGHFVNTDYPGEGGYVIKRERDLLLIAGADEEGALRGLKNFSVFLEGRGAWLLTERSRQVDKR